MDSEMMKTLRRIIFGMIAGIMLSFALCRMMHDQKRIQKKAQKAAHAFEDFLENMQHCLGPARG